jgi:predicted small lipoprotein YifL
MVRTVATSMLCVALLAVVAGCGRFGPAGGAVRLEQANPNAPTEELRDQVRKMTSERLAALERQTANNKNSLQRKKPYYYKEYVEYPGEPPELEVELRGADSRAVPYVAGVTVDKVRYATRLHRNKGDAQADGNFLRSTGEETITYELRSGYWTEVGSLFVAEKTEEYINGEWVPTQEAAVQVVAEERPGFFGRTWSRIGNIF